MMIKNDSWPLKALAAWMALLATGLVLTVAASAAPVRDPANPQSPVAQYGLLKIDGGHLCSAGGQPVQFRGMSLFWSQWSGAWYNPKAVGNLINQWGGSLLRVAMGVDSGGYLANPEAEKARVKTAVEAAIANGIYVIVDWHDHEAEKHLGQSVAFFTEMATSYKNVPNVMFEIYNEPKNASWPTVRSYAVSVIDAIRKTGARNVVIVGSPHWSQDVDQAAKDPIDQPNVAYSLHFYANSHRQALRDKALVALNKGLALVVTEWGTCDCSGNSGFNAEESDHWMKFLDEHQISWANWSLFDKNETASALKPGTSPTGPWQPSSLTPSGAFVVRHMSEIGRQWADKPLSAAVSDAPVVGTAVKM